MDSEDKNEKNLGFINKYLAPFLDRTAQTASLLMVIFLCIILAIRANNCQPSGGLEAGFTHILASLLGFIAHKQLGGMNKGNN